RLKATFLPLAVLCGPLAVLAQTEKPEPPRDWVDPATGHRVVRLSDAPGSASFYFHQNAYTAKGDLLVFTTPTGVSKIDLKTHKRPQAVEGRITNNPVVARKTRQVFSLKGETAYVTNLDTGASRAIVTRKELRTGSGLTLNADETEIGGSYVEGGAVPSPP